MFGGHGHGHHGHGHHGHHGQQQNNFNQQGGFNQGFNQVTGWAPSPGVHYKLVTALSHNMALDVSQNPNDFNKLIIYQYGGGPNQKFYFQSIGGNRYGIFCVKNNQTVEVPQGSQQNGARIVCSQPNKEVNEFW